jgi:hypothetical protein
MDLEGFSAWITVDGADLKHYNVEILDNGNKATCWIPSEAGKKFTINWRDSNRINMIGGFIKMDGISCGGNTINPGFVPVTIQKSSLPASSMTEKPFLFSPLELTDDDAYLDQSGASNNLGEIMIEIWRVAPIASTAAGRMHFPEAQKVHERSKKALAHRVKLGDEVYAPQKPTLQVKKIDMVPLVTFVFKYRSLDMLRANGIAPTSTVQKRPAEAQPEADVKEEVVDIEDDGDDEIRALERRLNTLKSRRLTSQGNPAKKVKREPRNQGAFVPGEIIDLT